MASDEQLNAAPPDPHLWKISSVAILGSFLSQMDATVVNVSLSSLALELHTTLSNIQWVTSGYLLALALALPLSGWIVDRAGTEVGRTQGRAEQRRILTLTSTDNGYRIAGVDPG